MAGRSDIAIDLGRRRFRAVLAGHDARVLEVSKVLSEDLPTDLDASADPAAVGAWAGRELVRAGFPRSSATIAISREHVALKRLNLPTADEDELPEMTRLAMQRDLPFDAEHAVIDFVTVERRERTTTVLAVAVPRPVLEFTREMAREAGLSVERVSLRNMGSAALVGSLGSENGAGGVLAVDITGERVEFSVVRDGFIRFSRAGDLPALDDPHELASAVVTETRRTWMSYRIVEDSDDVKRAVVIGDPRVSAEAAGSIGEILQVRTEVLDSHPLVECRGKDMDGVWPLAGLLLEPSLGLSTIDFEKPRRAPDKAGRRRQRVLALAGLAVVLGGVGITAARWHLGDLEAVAGDLREERRQLRPQYQRYWRDRFRLAHLEQWETARADWLEHMAHVVRIAPPRDRVVLDSWTGTLSFNGVEMEDRRGGGPVWSAPKEIRIVLEGEAADRATADRFRGQLVAGDTYAATTAGPDTAGGKRLPYGFRYQLRSLEGDPDGPDEADEPEAGP